MPTVAVMPIPLDSSLFDSIAGLPLHPLVVHFAVVLLPLGALGLVVLVLVPKWADRYGWLTVGAIAVGTGAAFVAKESGEALAAKYYMRRGYLLLNHNYRTRMGELDLVLYKDGQLVFAEVKTRAGRMLDAPAAAVDARKQRRLILAAQYYLQHSPYADASIRFDVVEVTPAGDAWQIHCIPDAFQC